MIGRWIDRSRKGDSYSLAAIQAVFRLRSYRALWASGSIGALGFVLSQLAISWLTLELTASPLAVGTAFAVRVTPQFLLGIPAGAVADVIDRRKLITATYLFGAAVALIMAVTTTLGGLSVAVIFAMTFALGVLDALRITAIQAYAYDIVGASQATTGIALSNMGAQLLGSAGAIIGGYSLQRAGSVVTFLIIVAAWISAATILAIIRPSPAGFTRRSPSLPNIRQGITLLLRNRAVASLSLAVVLAEIFGFSSLTLVPVFAKDVLNVGASGLGTMLAVRSAGGVVGLFVVAVISAWWRAGTLLLVTCSVAGIALVGFADTRNFALSLVFLGIAGGGLAVIDTLAQTLLQKSSEESERGSAMGVWVFSVGFGPVGLLAIGAAALKFNAPTAQVAGGIGMVAVAFVLTFTGSVRRMG